MAQKWRGVTEPPAEPETRSQVKYLQVIEDSLGWDGYQQLLDLLSEIAQAHGVSIANVATRYVLAQQGVAAAIVGVRNSRHVAQNAQVFSFDLSHDEVSRIRAFVDRYPTVAGEPFEQGADARLEVPRHHAHEREHRRCGPGGSSRVGPALREKVPSRLRAHIPHVNPRVNAICT